MSKENLSSVSPNLNFQSLKDLHREFRGSLSESLNLRVHRSLSWLKRAEMADDLDGRYIFLWVAFNAAYGHDLPDPMRMSEKQMFRNFLDRVVKLDQSEGVLADLVWQTFPGPIRVLLDNPYTFQPFWDCHNGHKEEAEWKRIFALEKQASNRALGNAETEKVLAYVFSRLYTLRNQLVHGGATWDSSLNRSQLKDGVAILHSIVPVILKLMISNPNQLWGDVSYPVVK